MVEATAEEGIDISAGGGGVKLGAQTCARVTADTDPTADAVLADLARHG
ncbi:hypothetical protein OIE67_15940 [Nonomuraea fuscirosea]|nr:hypothetical protein [Nonomuraea fuscirosea]WSA56039.1 hypothetical protein OIE67_15940 [Nonomuraea fuscirosea]